MNIQSNFQTQNDLFDQQSRLWDQKSSVRKKARVKSDSADIGGHWFPPHAQPVLKHPRIAERADDLKNVLLLHSLYLFLEDSALIETGTVNKVVSQAIRGYYPPLVTQEDKFNFLTVLTDESYHALAAEDFLRQVVCVTGVQPLSHSGSTNRSLSLDSALQQLPPELHDKFEFLAVCLAENTITDELIEVATNAGVRQDVVQLMRDHVMDELRHSHIFSKMLERFVASLSAAEKEAFEAVLPRFIVEIVRARNQSEHTVRLLVSLGFEAQDAMRIVTDCLPGDSDDEILRSHRISIKLRALLEKCGLSVRAE